MRNAEKMRSKGKETQVRIIWNMRKCKLNLHTPRPAKILRRKQKKISQNHQKYEKVQTELALTSNCRDFGMKRQRNTSQNHLKYEKVQAELAHTAACRDFEKKTKENKSESSEIRESASWTCSHILLRIGKDTNPGKAHVSR